VENYTNNVNGKENILGSAEILQFLDEFREQLVMIEVQIKDINIQKTNKIKKFLENTKNKLLLYRNSINNKAHLGKNDNKDVKIYKKRIEKKDLNIVANITSPLLEKKMCEFDNYLGGSQKYDKNSLKLVN